MTCVVCVVPPGVKGFELENSLPGASMLGRLNRHDTSRVISRLEGPMRSLVGPSV
jgi:hypothetical protein